MVPELPMRWKIDDGFNFGTDGFAPRQDVKKKRDEQVGSTEETGFEWSGSD